MALIEVDDDCKYVLDKLDSLRKHGTGTVIIEVRDHVVVDVNATEKNKRGKEFAIKQN